MSGKVQFFSEGLEFRPARPLKIKTWLKDVISREKRSLGDLNFIFCSDEVLLRMNEQFLNHKTLTDIITFDNTDGDSLISGDIYISVDRVLENSVKYSASFNDEVHRVMVHGVLHLIGYGDKNPKQKLHMREKEDAYLSLRVF